MVSAQPVTIGAAARCSSRTAALAVVVATLAPRTVAVLTALAPLPASARAVSR